jgi:hypothetical protein
VLQGGKVAQDLRRASGSGTSARQA